MNSKVINNTQKTQEIKYKPIERWKSFNRQEKIILPIIHLVLMILAIWVLLPPIFCLINSFKTVQEFNNDALSFPTVWQWVNYKNAFEMTYRNTNLIQMFFNSLIFTITFSLGNIGSSCLAAYVLCKYRFRGRKVIYAVAIIVQILPIFGGGGASYKLVSDLGLTDNLWLLWITGCNGFDYTFLIVYSYFENVSWEYSEAAQIDGAGNFYIFIRIMMPMVSPAVLTMWLSAVIGLWSDYMTPMIYLQWTPTLAAGLFNLKSLASFTTGGQVTYFAALIIACIPIIILYTLLQKKIFSINMEGGIKG